MKWINSNGGPLVCAEETIAKSWMGTEGLAIDDARTKSDYDRACATTEYLERLPCGTGKVLVLGDEPLQSAFVPAVGNQLVIARWMYAQSHDQVDAILASRVSGTSEVGPRLACDIKESALVLFDSALAGAELIDNFDSARIEPGSYEVTSEKLEMKGQYSFILHRFMKQ